MVLCMMKQLRPAMWFGQLLYLRTLDESTIQKGKQISNFVTSFPNAEQETLGDTIISSRWLIGMIDYYT